MGDIGIMLHGYGEDDARRIHAALEGVLGEEVELISASGMDQVRVMDILEEAPSDRFGDDERKILMVLGFSDEQLEATLRGFPKDEGLARPIFCTLTENNARWTLDSLIGDLQEERAYFERRAREARGDSA